MSSIVISEVYLLVAAVIAASVLAGGVAFTSTSLSDSMRAASQHMLDKSKVSVEAVFAFARSDQNYAIVWVKNVGERSFLDGEIRVSDVFFGPRGNFIRVKYGGGNPSWSYVIENDDGDGVWEPGETIRITVQWTSNLGSRDYYFRFVTHLGRFAELLFTPS